MSTAVVSGLLLVAVDNDAAAFAVDGVDEDDLAMTNNICIYTYFLRHFKDKMKNARCLSSFDEDNKVQCSKHYRTANKIQDEDCK